MLIQYKVFPNDFLKIGQMIKDEPKSAWKTNKNFLSNFVDSSQYWKFLKIFGNPQVISYKKISCIKKRVTKKLYSISVVFREFQRFSVIFKEFQRFLVSFMESQSISESFSPFQSFSVVFKAFQSILERFNRFQRVSVDFRAFRGV